MNISRFSIGWLLLAWLIVCGGIALNRGIDLLWGVVILLVVALVAAFFLPHLQLRRIKIQRILPAEAVIGESVPVAYRIDVASWFSGYGIELHDRLGETDEPVPAAYFRKIRTGQQIDLDWVPLVRGVRRFTDVVIESRFPLGLATARKRIQLPEHVLTVYPDYVNLRFLPVQAGKATRAEEFVSNRRGGRDEFFGLKAYRPGDDLRSVDWRASARTGETLVREYEHQQDRQLWIMLELSASVQLGMGKASTLEYMCRIAHSALLRGHAEGLPVGLCYRQRGQIHLLPPSMDYGGYLRVREALALVHAEGAPRLSEWTAFSRDELPVGGSWLIFNLGGEEGRARLAATARQRSATGLFVEFEPDSFTRQEESGPGAIRGRYFRDALVYRVGCGADLNQLFMPV